MNPRSPTLRGQQRNLRSIVDRALDEAKRAAEEDEEDEEDNMLETMLSSELTTKRRRSKTADLKPKPAQSNLFSDEMPAVIAPPVHKDPRIKGTVTQIASHE